MIDCFDSPDLFLQAFWSAPLQASERFEWSRLPAILRLVGPIVWHKANYYDSTTPLAIHEQAFQLSKADKAFSSFVIARVWYGMWCLCWVACSSADAAPLVMLMLEPITYFPLEIQPCETIAYCFASRYQLACIHELRREQCPLAEGHRATSRMIH